MMSVSHTVNPALELSMEPKGGIALAIEVARDNQAVIPNASVSVLNINSGETESKTTDARGLVKFDINPKQFYSITVAGNPDGGADSYKESSRTLSTAGKKLHDSLTITMQCTGNTFVSPAGLPYLFFNSNSFDIPTEANRNLDNIVTQMKANPTWELQISAYSDWNGTEQNKPQLAARRANACVDYLVAHGIDKKEADCHWLRR